MSDSNICKCAALASLYQCSPSKISYFPEITIQKHQNLFATWWHENDIEASMSSQNAMQTIDTQVPALAVELQARSGTPSIQSAYMCLFFWRPSHFRNPLVWWFILDIVALADTFLMSWRCGNICPIQLHKASSELRQLYHIKHIITDHNQQCCQELVIWHRTVLFCAGQ